jgi:hypothetical protein
VRLLLAATDPERRVKSRFNPPMVGLPAGGAATATLAVRAPVPWNRETQRALKLEAGGDGAYTAAPATFLQRPRFASKLAKVAGALGALAVIAGAILGSAVIANKVRPPWADPPPIPTVPALPTPPTVLPTAGASSVPPPAGSSAPGSVVPSAPTSAAVAAGGMKEVDLTRTGPGPVPSDAFRGDGLIVGGNPDRGGDAACVDAKSLAVRGTDAATRFLAASLPDRPDTCNTAAIQIRFINRASKVELVYVGPGDRRIEVNFKDLSRTTVTGSSVTDDGSHGGIDFVVVSGVAATGPAPAPALKAVRFIPLG